MSFTRKFLTSAALVVAEGALIGLAAGRHSVGYSSASYAALDAIISIPLFATSGTASQFVYSKLQNVPYVIRAVGTGVMGMLSSGVFLGSGYSYNGLFNSFSKDGFLSGLILGAPVGVTVAIVNGVLDYKVNQSSPIQISNVPSFDLDTKDSPFVHENSKQQATVICRNAELRTTFKGDLISSGIAGFIAGSFAQIQAGFKEGPIGGAIGGMVCETIANRLQKNGVLDRRISILLSMAATVLVDMGGLHLFGYSDNALIPYTDEKISMHHGVFYLALMMTMAGAPVVKDHILPSIENLFFTPPSQNRHQANVADEDYKLSHGL